MVLNKITWGADKSLARPTSQCISFDGENISFDASLVIYINSTNIPPIMIINRIYEHQNLLSLWLFYFLVGLRTYQHPCIILYITVIYTFILIVYLLVIINNKLILFSIISIIYSPNQLRLLAKLRHNPSFQHFLKETKQKKRSTKDGSIINRACLSTGRTDSRTSPCGHISTHLATCDPPARSTAAAAGQTSSDA